MKTNPVSYKTWEDTISSISAYISDERKVESTDGITVEVGFQFFHTLSYYRSRIYSTDYAENPTYNLDYFLANYFNNEEDKYFIIIWRYDPLRNVSSVITKKPISRRLRFLAWISDQKAIIGYTTDLKLHGYKSRTFNETFTMQVYSTITAMIYIKDFNMLVVATRGLIRTYLVRIIDLGHPLEESSDEFGAVLGAKVWVKSLKYDATLKSVIVLTDQFIYIIDVPTRKQTKRVENFHDANITSCTIFHQYNYLISAALNGTIIVYDLRLERFVHKIVTDRKGETGVSCIGESPSLVSWVIGEETLHLFRLDTFEKVNEHSVKGKIRSVFIVQNDRIFCQTASSIEIYGVNALFNVVCTFGSDISRFDMCAIHHLVANNHKKLQVEKNFVNYGPRLDRVEALQIAKEVLRSIDDKKEKEKERRQTENASLFTFKGLRLEEKDFDKGLPVVMSTPDLYRQKFLELNQFMKTAGESSKRVTKKTNNSKEWMETKLSHGELRPKGELMWSHPKLFSTDLIERLMVTLVDNNMVAISPVSAQVLHATYPFQTMNSLMKSVSLNMDGKSYVTALCDGSLLEIDCTRDPGEVTFSFPTKASLKVTSVAVVDVYFPDNFKHSVVFVGLENGWIKLFNEFRKYNDLRRHEYGDEENLTYDFETKVTLCHIHAHAEAVNILHSPREESLFFEHGKEVHYVKNVLVTGSSIERMVTLWRIETRRCGKTEKFEIKLRMLKRFKCVYDPTVMSTCCNTLLIGLNFGNVKFFCLSWTPISHVRGEYLSGRRDVSLRAVRTGPNEFECSESAHMLKVTDASASQLLRIFVTSSADGTVKVWDRFGELMREVVIGDGIRSICFPNGRDLWLSYRNHIIEIECQKFLPLSILQQMLLFESVPDAHLETPLAEGLKIEDYVKPDEELKISNEELELVRRTPSTGKFRKRKSKTSQKSKSSFKNIIESEEPKTEKHLKFHRFERKRSKKVEIQINTEDISHKAADHASELVEKMNHSNNKTFPVPNDGYIPNSVIRTKYVPVTNECTIEKKTPFDLKLLKDALYGKFTGEKVKGGDNIPLDLKLSTENVRETLKRARDHMNLQFEKPKLEPTFSSDDEYEGAKMVNFGDISKYLEKNVNQTTGKLVMNKLSRLHEKVKMYELKELHDPKTHEKELIANKLRIKTAEELLVELEKKADNSPTTLLKGLLQWLQYQTWCDHEVTFKNFKKTLEDIIIALPRTPPRLIDEVNKTMKIIFTICKEESIETDYPSRFTRTLQQLYCDNLVPFLSHHVQFVRKSSATNIDLFDIDIIQDALGTVLDGLVERAEEGFVVDYVLISDDCKLKLYSMRLATFASTLQSRCKELASVMGIKKEYPKYLEVDKNIERLENELEISGLTRPNNKIWAGFLLPNLHKKWDGTNEKKIGKPAELDSKKEFCPWPSTSTLYSSNKSRQETTATIKRESSEQMNTESKTRESSSDSPSHIDINTRGTIPCLSAGQYLTPNCETTLIKYENKLMKPSELMWTYPLNCHGSSTTLSQQLDDKPSVCDQLENNTSCSDNTQDEPAPDTFFDLSLRGAKINPLPFEVKAPGRKKQKCSIKPTKISTRSKNVQKNCHKIVAERPRPKSSHQMSRTQFQNLHENCPKKAPERQRPKSSHQVLKTQFQNLHENCPKKAPERQRPKSSHQVSRTQFQNLHENCSKKPSQRQIPVSSYQKTWKAHESVSDVITVQRPISRTVKKSKCYIKPTGVHYGEDSAFGVRYEHKSEVANFSMKCEKLFIKEKKSPNKKSLKVRRISQK